MRTILATMCVVVSLCVSGGLGSEPSKQPLKRVLLITGRDVPAHCWRETTPILREHLEKTKRFEVVVSEEPLVLESSALAKYDAIVINYYNWERESITDKAKENLLKFVKDGKGLVSFHFTCRAFGEWKEFQKLIGRIWIGGQSGHGPRGEFQTKVVDKDHFITQGVADFKADDELYAKLVGDSPIHVLVEAYSDWSKRVEPLAWTLEYGKGRVFNIVLGHDVKAVKDPNFGKLFQRGTRWIVRDEKK